MLKHADQSTQPDDPNPALIGSTKWNKDHVFSGGTHKQLLMRDTGDPMGNSWTSTPTVSQFIAEIVPGAAVSTGFEGTPGVLMSGDLTGNRILEIHNRFAVGAAIYVHNDAGFRAPYINFWKTRGSQSAPTPPTLTGYEQDSLGGMNFGGWDGTTWTSGAAIFSQVDEDWSPTNRGGHLSIYGRNRGSSTLQQIVQFGGLDPTDAAAHTAGETNNVIMFRALVWGNNKSSSAGIFKHPTLNGRLMCRLSDNSAGGGFDVGNLGLGAGTFAFRPAAPTEGTLYAVTDSTTNVWGATVTGGGANHVLAYYNGTNWTVFGK